jgi:hypothetical protein
MKPFEIYQGLQVVVSDANDATLYTVGMRHPKNKHIFNLTYKLPNGTTVSAGDMDASLMRLPTIQQLVN